MRRFSIPANFFPIAFIAMAFGCSTPAERIDGIAHAAGFSRNTVSSDPFEHLILTENTDGVVDGDLHIYIEGDGSPWIANRWVATDPTPRSPVMLELMQLDTGPALYVGRPCYFGLQQSCESAHWTYGRYSETVVESMAVALNTAIEQLDLKGDIVLIGHSGGGVLAMLLAPRIPNVEILVMIAANLDIDRWTQYHGYSPLHSALNPANRAPLPDHIVQFHLVGELDSNVPIQLVRPIVDREPNAQLLHYRDFDHNCCWAEIWPSILDRLRL